MRHNWFRAKDSSFKIISEVDTAISVWTFTLADGLIAQDSVTSSSINDDYYKGVVLTGSTDCFMLVKHGDTPGIVRVGDPEVLTIAHTGITGETHAYVQYDMDGGELGSGNMVEIGEGFYYVEPASLDESFFVLGAGGLIKNLSVPYKIVVCTEGGGDGISSTAYWGNTGFNMFGFLGERHSYFDQGNGAWVNDDTIEAKASDLAKAVCHKYGLVWDDQADANWIGNYIKYIRSYTENDGKIRYYKPYKTPDTNDANFTLMQDDEAGNVVVKGISMLLLQTLETLNSTDGALIPFREV